MFFFVVFLISPSYAEVCRSISLEGGGGRGAYEAGAIWALTNLSSPEDVAYNVVTGISAGSLNAFAVCQFAMGDEVAMSEYILNLWLSLNGTDSVYKKWEGGDIDGLLFHSSIYNTAPLIETLRNDFKYGVHRNVTVGSTNLDTGLFANFNESLGNAILDAVICSSSIPFVFPPHQFEGYSWADGGCIINLDPMSSVTRCLDVTTEANIILDIALDHAYSALPAETKFKTLNVFERMYDIKSYDKQVMFIYNTMVAFPQVHYRYIIHPSGPMAGPLNFTKANFEYEINLAIKDVTALIQGQVDGKTVISELFNEIKAKVIYP